MKRTLRMFYIGRADGIQAGLVRENAPDLYKPLTSQEVAHTLIEHDDNSDFKLHDEIKALGVAHWGRGQGDYWDRINPGTAHPTAPENLHGEIAKLFIEWVTKSKALTFNACPWNRIEEDGQTILVHPPGHEMDRTVLSPEGIKMISETIRLVRNFPGDDLMYGPPEDEQDLGYDKLMSIHLPQIELWMQVGWAEAEERFSETNPHDLVTAYIKMEKALDYSLKGASCEGDVCTLTWDDTDPTAWNIEWEDLPPYKWGHDAPGDLEELVKVARATANKMRWLEDQDERYDEYTPELLALEEALDQLE